MRIRRWPRANQRERESPNVTVSAEFSDGKEERGKRRTTDEEANAMRGAAPSI